MPHSKNFFPKTNGIFKRISGIFAFAVTAVFLILLMPRLAFAASDPAPSISANTSSFDLMIGDTKDVRLTVNNIGGSASTYYVDVSVSDGLDITTSTTSGIGWHKYPIGTKIWKSTDTTGPTFPSTNLLYSYESNPGSFPANYPMNFDFTVKAKNTGSQWIKYRASLLPTGKTQTNTNFIRAPKTGETDQQGWYANKISGSVQANITKVYTDDTNWKSKTSFNINDTVKYVLEADANLAKDSYFNIVTKNPNNQTYHNVKCGPVSGNSSSYGCDQTIAKNSVGGAYSYTITLGSKSKSGTFTVTNKSPSVSLSSPSGSNISRDTDLFWSGSDADGDTLGYEVYFGTSNPPPSVASTSSTSYDPGTMAAGTTYYWKIKVTDGGGASASSSVNSFTTIQPTRSVDISNISPTSPTVGNNVQFSASVKNTGNIDLSDVWFGFDVLNGSTKVENTNTGIIDRADQGGTGRVGRIKFQSTGITLAVGKSTIFTSDPYPLTKTWYGGSSGNANTHYYTNKTYTYSYAVWYGGKPGGGGNWLAGSTKPATFSVPPDPAPSASTNYDGGFSIEPGQSKDVNFSIANNGGSAFTYYVDVSVSSDLDISPQTSTNLWKRYNPGSMLYHKGSNSQDLKSDYLLYSLEGYERNFAANSSITETLRISAKSTASSDQWIKYRVAMLPYGVAPSNSPDTFKRIPTSGDTDQQSWNVKTINITVPKPKVTVSTSNLITSAKVPESKQLSVTVTNTGNLNIGKLWFCIDIWAPDNTKVESTNTGNVDGQIGRVGRIEFSNEGQDLTQEQSRTFASSNYVFYKSTGLKNSDHWYQEGRYKFSYTAYANAPSGSSSSTEILDGGSGFQFFDLSADKPIPKISANYYSSNNDGQLDLRNGEEKVVWFKVKNEGATSQSYYVDVSSGPAIAVTNYDGWTKYPKGSKLYSKGSSSQNLTSTYDLYSIDTGTEHPNGFPAGTEKTFSLKIKCTDTEALASSLWIKYRVSMNPYGQKPSNYPDTFIRFPTANESSDTDQQGWNAFKIVAVIPNVSYVIGNDNWMQNSNAPVKMGKLKKFRIGVKNEGLTPIKSVFMGLDIRADFGQKQKVESTFSPKADPETGIQGSIRFNTNNGTGYTIAPGETVFFESEDYSFTQSVTGHTYLPDPGIYKIEFMAWEGGQPGQDGATPLSSLETSNRLLIVANATLEHLRYGGGTFDSPELSQGVEKAKNVISEESIWNSLRSLLFFTIPVDKFFDGDQIAKGASHWYVFKITNDTPIKVKYHFDVRDDGFDMSNCQGLPLICSWNYNYEVDANSVKYAVFPVLVNADFGNRQLQIVLEDQNNQTVATFDQTLKVVSITDFAQYLSSNWLPVCVAKCVIDIASGLLQTSKFLGESVWFDYEQYKDILPPVFFDPEVKKFLQSHSVLQVIDPEGYELQIALRKSSNEKISQVFTSLQTGGADYAFSLAGETVYGVVDFLILDDVKKLFDDQIQTCDKLLPLFNVYMAGKIAVTVSKANVGKFRDMINKAGGTVTAEETLNADRVRIVAKNIPASKIGMVSQVIPSKAVGSLSLEAGEGLLKLAERGETALAELITQDATRAGKWDKLVKSIGSERAATLAKKFGDGLFDLLERVGKTSKPEWTQNLVSKLEGLADASSEFVKLAVKEKKLDLDQLAILLCNPLYISSLDNAISKLAQFYDYIGKIPTSDFRSGFLMKNFNQFMKHFSKAIDTSRLYELEELTNYINQGKKIIAFCVSWGTEFGIELGEIDIVLEEAGKYVAHYIGRFVLNEELMPKIMKDVDKALKLQGKEIKLFVPADPAREAIQAKFAKARFKATDVFGNQITKELNLKFVDFAGEKMVQIEPSATVPPLNSEGLVWLAYQFSKISQIVYPPHTLNISDQGNGKFLIQTSVSAPIEGLNITKIEYYADGTLVDKIEGSNMSFKEYTLDTIAKKIANGKHKIKVIVYDDSGYAMSDEKEITVYNEYAGKIDIVTAPDTGKRGKEVVYSLEVANSGIKNDAYNLSAAVNLVEAPTSALKAEDATNWDVKFDQSQLRLAPGEAKTVKATASIAGSAIDGNYEMAFKALSQQGKVYEEKTNLKVESIHKAELKVDPQTIEIIPGQKQKFTLEILNQGDLDAFRLDDESNLVKPVGPWIQSTAVNPNESVKGIAFEYEIPKDAKAGDYQITWKLTSQYSNKEIARITSAIKITAISSVELKVVSAPEKVIQGQMAEFALELKNTGNVTRTYTVFYSGVDLGVVNQTFSIEPSNPEPGKTAIIKIGARLAKDFKPGKYTLTALVQTTDYGFSEYKKDVNFEVVSSNLSTKVSIIPNGNGNTAVDTIDISPQSSSLLFVKVINNGNFDDTFDIHYELPAKFESKAISGEVPWKDIKQNESALYNLDITNAIGTQTAVGTEYSAKFWVSSRIYGEDKDHAKTLKFKVKGNPNPQVGADYNNWWFPTMDPSPLSGKTEIRPLEKISCFSRLWVWNNGNITDTFLVRAADQNGKTMKYPWLATAGNKGGDEAYSLTLKPNEWRYVPLCLYFNPDTSPIYSVPGGNVQTTAFVASTKEFLSKPEKDRTMRWIASKTATLYVPRKMVPVLSADPSQSLVNAGDSLKLKLKVTNKGNYNLFFIATGPGIAGYWYAGVDQNKSTEKDIEIKIPSNAKPGDYELSWNLNSLSSSDQINTQAKYTVKEQRISKPELSAIQEISKAPSSDNPETITYQVSLANKGNFKETYSIAAESKLKVTLDKNSIELEPGKSANISATISAKDAVAGDYDLTLSAKGEASASISTKISIKPIYSADLNVQPKIVEVKPFADNPGDLIVPGKKYAEFTASLTNTGNVQDSYKVTGKSSDPNWFVTFQPPIIPLDENSLKCGDQCPGSSWNPTLKPGETAKTKAYVVYGQTKSYGSIPPINEIKILWESYSNGAKQVVDKDTTTVFVKQLASFSFDGSLQTPSVKPGDKVRATLALINTGNVALTIKLSGDGILPQTIDLKPLEKKTISVEITTDKKALAGNYKLTWNAWSNLVGNKTVSQTYTIERVASTRLIAPERIAVKSGSQNYVNISIANDGNGEDTYYLNAILPQGWTANLPGAITLKAYQTKDTNVIINVPAKVSTAENPITLLTKGTYSSATAKTIAIVMSAIFPNPVKNPTIPNPFQKPSTPTTTKPTVQPTLPQTSKPTTSQTSVQTAPATAIPTTPQTTKPTTPTTSQPTSPTTTAPTTPLPKVIVNENFDGYAEGSRPKDWQVKSAGVSGKVTAEKSVSGNSFRLESGVNSARQEYLNLTMADQISYALSVYIPDMQKGVLLGLYDPAKDSWQAALAFENGGKIVLRDSAATLGNYEAGKWYKVKVSVNLKAKTASIWLNDVQIAKDLPTSGLPVSAFSLKGLDFQTGTSAIYADQLLIQAE